MLAKTVPWVGLALVVAATLVLRAPRELMIERERTVIDPDAFVHDSGLAYIAPVDVEGESDAEGHSGYGLVEDGVPLVAHTPHSVVREQGGHFSHWGARFWLSATDGSDPRTNGRVYALLAPGVPRFEEAHVWGALLAGGALVVLGALLARGRARIPTGLACVATAVLVFVASAPRREAGTWRDLMATAGTVTDPAPPPRRGPSGGEPPRTARLLDKEDVAFERAGALPEEVPDLALAFAEAGEPVSLGPGEFLAARPHPELGEDDLDVLTIRARITAGSVLTVRAHLTTPADEGEEHVDVSIPVEPSDAMQRIAVRNVFMHKTGRGRRVVRLELGCAAVDPGPLELVLEDVTCTSRWATYARAPHGRAVVVARRDRRPAVWQSVPGAFALGLVPGHGGDVLRGAVHATATGSRALVPVEVVLLDTEGNELARDPRRLQPGGPWIELDLALPAACARLVLRAPELPPRTAVAWAGWRTIDTDRPARRVVAVLIDTLRADALGCYGNPRVRTPALDGLAAQGTRWARCYSQAHWTRASMPSIMTGHYVPATGVQRLSDRLPASYATLAEAMAGAGFHTVSLIANFNAGPAAGLGQGFDELRIDYGQDTGAQLEQSVTPRIERLDVEDLFVYVHVMEAHAPYGPEERPADWTDPPGEPRERDERFDRPWVETPTSASRIALYERDVESLDAALGRFLDRWLPAWEREGEPVVVAVLSDHGEFLGEFDTWGHVGLRHVPEVTHTPLIVRAPGRLPAGEVVDAVVENRNVGATLLDLAGARTDVPLAGRSLLREVPPIAISNCLSGGRGLFSVYGEPGALVGVASRFEGRARPAAPPAPFARTSIGSVVVDDLDERFVRLWERYEAQQAAVRQTLWSAAAVEGDAAALDAAALESLRAMGYLGY